MKKIGIAIAALLFGSLVYAQDLHFTQTSQTPLLINPAATGVFNGWERLTINHRSQWLGSATKFNTTAIAADANLGKSRTNDKAYLGLGLLFFNDAGGDSNFGNTQGALSVSGVIPMGGYGHSISAGIQGGFGQRRADASLVTFNSQWNGSGFDNTVPSGEVITNSFAYADASAGLFYSYDGGQSTFSRNRELKVQFGVSGWHLNAPKLKFANGVEGERLHRKFVAHFRLITEIGTSKWSIDGSAAQFIQGGHYETIFGGMARYRFENGSKVTGFEQDAYLAFGAFFRYGDAIAPTVSLDWRGFMFGMSYDVTVSQMRNAYTGSLEFSLSYRNLHHAIFKTKNRRF